MEEVFLYNQKKGNATRIQMRKKIYIVSTFWSSISLTLLFSIIQGVLVYTQLNQLPKLNKDIVWGIFILCIILFAAYVYIIFFNKDQNNELDFHKSLIDAEIWFVLGVNTIIFMITGVKKDTLSIDVFAVIVAIPTVYKMISHMFDLRIKYLKGID